jgi:hypothetical protein
MVFMQSETDGKQFSSRSPGKQLIPLSRDEFSINLFFAGSILCEHAPFQFAWSALRHQANKAASPATKTRATIT